MVNLPGESPGFSISPIGDIDLAFKHSWTRFENLAENSDYIQ
jgi:hypothetical protein